MTTIVNTPPAQKDSSGVASMIFGLIIMAIIGYIFFVYGLPALQNLKLGAPQINVPDKIELNIKQN